MKRKRRSRVPKDSDLSKYYDKDRHVIPFTCRKGSHIYDEQGLDECIEYEDCDHCLEIRHHGIELLYARKRQRKTPHTTELLILARKGMSVKMRRLWAKGLLRYGGDLFCDKYAQWLRKRLTRSGFRDVYLGYDSHDDMFLLGTKNEETKECRMFEFIIAVTLDAREIEFVKNPRGHVSVWSWYGKFMDPEGFFCLDFADNTNLTEIYLVE